MAMWKLIICYDFLYFFGPTSYNAVWNWFDFFIYKIAKYDPLDTKGYKLVVLVGLKILLNLTWLCQNKQTSTKHKPICIEQLWTFNAYEEKGYL